MKLVARTISTVFVLATLVISSQQALSEQTLLKEKPLSLFPQIQLNSKPLSGQDAIQYLGGQLGNVAKWYNKTPEQLQKLLLKDKRVKVDETGRLFVVEELDAPINVPSVLNDTTSVENTTQFLEQTFFLHSRPGAKRTIYLDFNGEVITGTAWNKNVATINAKPYDIDGNPSTFSTTELQRIQYIWQRVAEDYAPFDVDVTTEAPPVENLVRSDSNDSVFGTTVVITDSRGVYDCQCGGVAYVGIFNSTSSYYKPALVFYNQLNNGSEKSVAEAISHEVGHNVGLHHDGTSTTTYYEGHGTDKTTAWAPIMGVGYYKPLVQFSPGAYPNANNTEDDFVVAQSFGLPLRQDDYGNNIYSSTPFTSDASVHNNSVDGVIEYSTDSDVFSVQAGVGLLVANVMPATRSPNVDLIVTLISSSGQVLAVGNPVNTLPASVSFNVPVQGTYFIEVRAGNNGCTSSFGYPTYGSVGNFRLTVDYVPPAGSAPNAVIVTNASEGAAPLSVALDGSRSSDDGKVMFWYWDFGDGTSENSGSLVLANHTYEVPGTYYAKLTVVDNTGLRSTTTSTITVGEEPAHTHAQNIVVSIKKSKKGSYAVAKFVVVNQLGQRVRNATLTVTWSGAVNSSTTIRSRSGSVSVKSPISPVPGCFTVTVTNITVAGYAFNTRTLPTAQYCN